MRPVNGDPQAAPPSCWASSVGRSQRLEPSRHSAADPRPIEFMILVTGSELLSGVYADSHTFFITRTLTPLGLHCVGSMSVDDRAEDIRQALDFATARARLVIVTGGLGPTESDVTREVLSAYTGMTLDEHPDVLREMEQRFGVARDALRANLRRQTRVPTQGTYLKNSSGTAVGLVFPTDRNVIVALPGPPRELQPMVSQQLVPYLSQRYGTKRPGQALTVRFVGIGQSQIEQSLKDHVALPEGVHVSSQFDGGRVDYTFALPEDTPQAEAILDQLKAHVVEQLGDYVYGTNGISLEEHVLELLRRRGQTLVMVEVASGGALTAGLHSADSADNSLGGALVAPTMQQLSLVLKQSEEAVLNGTSSEQQLQQIAAEAARATGSDWSLAIGPRSDLPQERQEFIAVLREPGGAFETLRCEGSGTLDRVRLTTQLLDQLRRRLR